MSALYIGLMSGTSLDGIDAILADCSNDIPKVISAHSQPFPNDLQQKLKAMIASQNTALLDLGQIHTYLGECYAKAVLVLLAQAAIRPEGIKAIGNHGQTVFHHPQAPYPFTLQIGNHAVVAAKTGIPVVADFRSIDVAYGGQGAPLAPLFHQAALSQPNEKIAVVNIGGIANVTVLNGHELIAAFDTGPGNGLIDAWMEHCFQKAYDDNGNSARNGKLIPQLLSLLLEDAYLHKSPPKSTGKEYFNLNWLNAAEQNLKALNPADVLATLTELTARSITNALLPFSVNKLWICGGGALNSFLIERLQQLNFDKQVASIAAIGLNPFWIEPLAFAWLAKMRIENQRIATNKITGSQADRSLLLGQIYYP